MEASFSNTSNSEMIDLLSIPEPDKAANHQKKPSRMTVSEIIVEDENIDKESGFGDYGDSSDDDESSASVSYG